MTTLGPDGSFSLELESSLTGGEGFGLPEPPGGAITSASTWVFQAWIRLGNGEARLSPGLRVTFH